MDSTLNLMLPLKKSFANGEIEEQLKSLLIDVFEELFSDQIEDIHHYGMPHLGSPNVVERFTKQDGLVVLRRPDSSDLIMRVIYTTWKSLGSKRGLAFLEFVLQMLIGNHWQIRRMYHSIARKDVYPSLALPFKQENSFLTSRIMIDFDQTVNIEEMTELAPTLFRLVPANIVPTLSTSADFEGLSDITMSIAATPCMVADFQHIDLESIYLPIWDWKITTNYRITVLGEVVFHGNKSDGKNLINGTATAEMDDHILNQLSNPKFQESQNLRFFIYGIYPRSAGIYFNNAEKVLYISYAPEFGYNHNNVMAIVLARFYQDPDFVGREPLDKLVNYFDWIIEENKILELKDEEYISVEEQVLLDSLDKLYMDAIVPSDNSVELQRTVQDLIQEAYRYDPVLGCNELFEAEQEIVSYSVLRDEIIASTEDLDLPSSEYSRNFIIEIASTVHELNENDQVISANWVKSEFEKNSSIFTISTQNYLPIENIDIQVG